MRVGRLVCEGETFLCLGDVCAAILTAADHADGHMTVERFALVLARELAELSPD